MARPGKGDVARALLSLHGRTFAEELRIDLRRPTPSPLFRLLCAALLMSARIDSAIATEAARGLSRRGWRSAGKLAASTWRQRVGVLNDAGYTRYQERTATMLGETAGLILDRYDGDLRKLRDEAGHDPRRERTLLRKAKGIGDTGVDIFFREVQVAWRELAPFADGRALKAARRLELGDDPETLARRVPESEFARLAAALVRCELADDYDTVRERARGH